MSDTQDPRTEAQAAIQYWSNRLNEIEGQQAQAPTDIPPEQPYAVPTTPYLPPREMAERIHREAIANGATEAESLAVRARHHGRYHLPPPGLVATRNCLSATVVAPWLSS